MSVIYIAAAAAVGLLIGFVILSILWLRKTMLTNVRSHTLDLLSVYDQLLAEKSDELERLNRQIDQQKRYSRQLAEVADTPQQAAEKENLSPETIISATQRAGLANYTDGEITQVYTQIRDAFSFDVNTVARTLAHRPGVPQGTAGRLLENLNFDTVYHLSTLTPDEQLDILKSSLSPEETELIQDYITAYKTFDVLGFYDYLKAIGQQEATQPVIYVPSGRTSHQVLCGVDIVEDMGLREGFGVQIDGKFYDYGIRRRDMN